MITLTDCELDLRIDVGISAKSKDEWDIRAVSLVVYEGKLRRQIQLNGPALSTLIRFLRDHQEDALQEHVNEEYNDANDEAAFQASEFNRGR